MVSCVDYRQFGCIISSVLIVLVWELFLLGDWKKEVLGDTCRVELGVPLRRARGSGHPVF